MMVRGIQNYQDKQFLCDIVSIAHNISYLVGQDNIIIKLLRMTLPIK